MAITIIALLPRLLSILVINMAINIAYIITTTIIIVIIIVYQS